MKQIIKFITRPYIIFYVVAIIMMSFPTRFSYISAQSVSKILSPSQRDALRTKITPQICLIRKTEILKPGIHRMNQQPMWLQGIHIKHIPTNYITQHLDMYIKHTPIKLFITTYLGVQASSSSVIQVQLQSYCEGSIHPISFQKLKSNQSLWEKQSHHAIPLVHDPHLGISLLVQLDSTFSKKILTTDEITSIQHSLKNKIQKTEIKDTQKLSMGEVLYMYQDIKAPLYQMTTLRKGTGMWSFYWVTPGQYTFGSPLFDHQASIRAMIAITPFNLGPSFPGWNPQQTRLIIPHHAIQQFLHSIHPLITSQYE